MSGRTWPDSLTDGVSVYELANLDPDEPPRGLRVAVWRSLSGSDAKAMIEDEKHARFANIAALDPKDASCEVEHLRAVIAEWEAQDDAAATWRALIVEAMTTARRHLIESITADTARAAGLAARIDAATNAMSVLWVCQECLYYREVPDDERGLLPRDPRPWALWPETNLSRMVRGVAAEYCECGYLETHCDLYIERHTEECETIPFSRVSCDGCGSRLGGERYAYMMFDSA